MKVIALIPAAGAGIRMGGNIPKQFLKLKGKPIIAHTLSRLEECEGINEVVLVLPGDEVKYCQKDIIDHYGFQKIKKIVPGGEKRQDSVYLGLETMPACDIVLVHDGVRPFVTASLLEETIIQADNYDACIVGVPAKDTIKTVSSRLEVIKTLKRKMVWIIQTPQTFRYDILKKAYQQAYQDGFYGTDDASLVERLGVRIKVIEGSYRNIKITTPEDLTMAKNILPSRA